LGDKSHPFLIKEEMKRKIFILIGFLLLNFNCKFEHSHENANKNLFDYIRLRELNSSEIQEIVQHEIQANIKDDQESIVDSVKIIQESKGLLDQIENEENKKSIKGLYLTAYKTLSSDFYKILDLADSAQINTVVFDLKNMNGEVFFRTPQNQFLTSENLKPIIDIPKVVKTLHARNMKAVSRMVMFHDMFNAKRDSTIRPQNSDGTTWIESERRGPAWLDSSHPEVQNYLLGLIEQAAKFGVDEIQMDYIRFPTQGNSENASFYFQRADSLMMEQDSTYVPRTRADIITGFLRRAKKICEKYNVTLTADVFAIVAWQRQVDISSTGQDIKRMTEYLDFIHPMIYSSHFDANFGYRENIYNEPYFILYKGTQLTKNNSTSDCGVVPYIQANTWKVNYKKEYVISQIKAIEELNAGGYILWNSSNVYTKTLTWLKEYYRKPD
jgi:hypothetical protein